ncbi:NAD(P)-dependent dehydrogenase, short-chain alcohol dehydrogenase family [Hyphomicrobiales bacterium]|nr:NAD(P)-dependent dehydrogenase, short-chain alcohol dehydrogenase family [Hyphomicrobiales bacterium]CAH1691890.1 NAD(P)-dependent dehydrogenase, short-chain alcohol dehydrogenase family [Hyphomicrobiales bacterium]
MRGTVVAITGGASGIGLATAQACLEAGWNAFILDADIGPVTSGTAGLGRWDGRYLAERVDVRDAGALAAALPRARDRLGPLEGLVNSAAIARDVPFVETSATLFREVLDVNVIGAFTVAQAFVKLVREQATPAAIVNVASASGLKGNVGRTAYGASKGALITMTKVMAVELAAMGIRANAVAPGPIDTPLTQHLHTPAARKRWQELVPMRRYGLPTEVAQTIRFLLESEMSGYVNGQVLGIDGGMVEGCMLPDHEETSA